MAKRQTEARVDEEAPGAAAAETDGAATVAAVDPAEVLEEDLTALMQQLQEQERLAAENQDKFLRTLADFDNYRKRTRQEMEDAGRNAVKNLVADLLGVLDSFERALQHTGGSEGSEAVREGVLLIHRQLLDTLVKHGVQPIEALGEPFDPQFHEAIMRVEPSDEHPAGTVVEELRKGYLLQGRVLRATLVKVAGE
jgi:molecular chaperone GrpE